MRSQNDPHDEGEMNQNEEPRPQFCDHAVVAQRKRSSFALNLRLGLESDRGMLTVALLGYDGGEILRRGIADFPIVVRSDYIPRIQEVQASTYHLIRETLEVFAHA